MGVLAFSASSRSRLAVGAALAVAAAGLPAYAAVRPPNLLVITTEGLGYSDLGCYGGEIPTPHIDALAAAGLRFSQFYTGGDAPASQAALITGCPIVQRPASPMRSGSLATATGPELEQPLPQRLRRRGYRSYHSGLWQARGLPLPCRDGGFDRSYWVADSDSYFRPSRVFRDDRLEPAGGLPSDYYSTRAIADQTTLQLADHARRGIHRPFFALVAFPAPRFPLQAPAGAMDHLIDRYLAGWDQVRRERYHRLLSEGFECGPLAPIAPDEGAPGGVEDVITQISPDEVAMTQPWDSLTPGQQRFQARKMALHAAMVVEVDRAVGRIIDQVKAMGEWPRTIVVFLAESSASPDIVIPGDANDTDAQMGSADSYLCLGPGWAAAANSPWRNAAGDRGKNRMCSPMIWRQEAGGSSPGAWRRSPIHLYDLTRALAEDDAAFGPGRRGQRSSAGGGER